MTFTRNVLLVICILFSSATLAVASENSRWNNVIKAIVAVESGGDVNAKNGIYAGPMQISPICVKQCNQILESKKSKKRYTLDDRFNLQKSKEMFILIQEMFNPNNDIEWAIRSWNGGPKFSIKSTNSYYNKVMAMMNK